VPVSAHVEMDVVPSLTQADGDLAIEGELEGIRHQVQHDLFPLRSIDVDRFGDGRTIDLQLQTCRFDERPERSRKPCGEHREVGRLERRRQAVRFDAGEIEKIVDEAEQTERVAMHGFEDIAPKRLRRINQGIFEGPRMSVSGVRNSWLTLLKNSVLRRSISADASARRRSSSCAWAVPSSVASCPATSSRKS
jgi:hypothetical protein